MKQQALQKRSFLIIASFIASILLLLEVYNHPFDLAFSVYILVVILVSTCLGFWIFWGLISIRPLSPMFKIIGVLMIGIDYVWIVNIYSRYLFIYDYDKYHNWMNSHFFAFRSFLLLIIFSIFLAWIIGRFFGEKEKIKFPIENARLLVVDDDLQVRGLLTQCAQSVGIVNIDNACDYKTAIDFIQQHSYNCALIDLKLRNSVKDGAVLVFDLREKDPDIIIYIISGYNESLTDEILCLIDGVIDKPFGMNMIKQLLKIGCFKSFRVRSTESNRAH